MLNHQQEEKLKSNGENHSNKKKAGKQKGKASRETYDIKIYRINQSEKQKCLSTKENYR